MKKENVYVPIANKKEAKRAKTVLKALGEKCSERFYIGNETGLWYYEEEGVWSCCQEGGNNYQNRTKITLKQLIELLVSEQQEPEKIAVRVDNEKEFNALMKYYDSLGWKSYGGKRNSDLVLEYFPYFIDFHDNHDRTRNKETQTRQGYKIIPFSEFAKEHGIRVPFIVSEDGVELFEGDDLFYVWESSRGWVLLNVYTIGIGITNTEVFSHPTDKAFSTREAALDWIEAQKPKEVKVCIGNFECTVTTKGISFNEGVRFLSEKSFKSIHKAMEELNS